MIASRKKAETLRGDLEKKGLSSEALAAVKAPAGLDINAVTPEEIAVSILAETSSEFSGMTYYFCCGGCKETFDREPHKFAAAA